jgi:hypothetical protein
MRIVHALFEFVGQWTVATTVIMGGCFALRRYLDWRDAQAEKRQDAAAAAGIIERSKCPSSWVHVGKGEK